MDEERDPSPPGDGPYRTPPARAGYRRRWVKWAIAGGVATALIAVVVSRPEVESRSRPSLSTVPPDLFDAVTAWPPPEDELPPSTPLAPLLVRDQPEAVAVLHPGEGAIRLRRGEALHVRFNRPMVEGREVGRTAEVSPIVFEPPLEGTARWTSRSQVSFQPEPGAWTTGVREVHLDFAEGLASLSGEELADNYERVVVLDGAPRVDPYRSSGRVSAGAPLPLIFDAHVPAASLAREILAYEVGGGQRSLPITLTAARDQPERGYRIDVWLRRALEPGARIALALAPRYLPWGGSNPAVVTYELAPRPHIEGIACNEGAAHAGQCSYRESPGAVIDIGPTLRLLSSARLRSVTAANLRIRPALRDMEVRLAPHGPPQHRLFEVRGEWDPDQVYEVRVSGLRTEDGEPVRALPPLAVRSSGHAPQIRVASGHLAFESDAAAELPFAVVHPGPSDVLYRAVAPGDELRALVSPSPFVRNGGVTQPLAPLAPLARPNRWGPGRYTWRGAGGRDSSMAVVAFRPNPSQLPNAIQTAFVQSTDLGVTVRANREGLIVWVTRLSDGTPVDGARITVADSEARERAEASTDADGIARIPLGANPLVTSHAVRVVSGDDRAALLIDPRRAVGPSSMGLTPGTTPEGDAPIATVFTDRGAYRPGEGVHAKIVLRRVDRARVTAVRDGRFIVRLFSPDGAAAQREIEVHPSRYGTAAVDFDLPSSASPGSWRIEVVRRGLEEILGQTTLRVAQFRQPTFRVDLTRIAGDVHAGDEIGIDASATYFFGAPVTTGRVRWSLLREGEQAYPRRWNRFRFTPVGASAGRGTVASGEEAIGADGRLHIDARVQLAASVRTRLSLEVEVTDRAGHTQASRRSFTAFPAEVEVGLERGDEWIELGAELSLRAIVIDHDGEPVPDHGIEATFVREGWHSWWEWSEGSHRYEGSYQLRRDQRAQGVHRCSLRSGAEPVHCGFTPTRPGTYRIMVTTTDSAGRRSTASRRVYVAGPDEHPDRDPPGAPIAVTPIRRAWTVGETAELAFECPWERAEALITVEREGTMRVERRSVDAGGQIIRIPITEDMIPNVFVGVTLVRPRTGPPEADVDLNAPDLRFGIAELLVTPSTSELVVTLELEASARPGTEVPVTVQVRDADGNPVRGEVTLWAVDEGTLRLTAYQAPNPLTGLFRPHPAAFAWEDIRRELVSRVAVPPMPEASGDGNDGQRPRQQVDDRERFDPTPLWAPRLITDGDGRVSATIVLPERPTEYRVMAVVIDARARSGRASAQLVAEQPIVVRPAFPQFLTAGDLFEAAAFVHNATDEDMTVEVWVTVGEDRQEHHRVEIPAGGEVRVARMVRAPIQGPMALRIDARAGDEHVAVTDAIAVMPRGRWVRSQVFGAAVGARSITVGLPSDTPTSGPSVMVTVASHPFVGFEGAIDALEASTWAGTEPIAATLLGMVAYAELGIADRAHGHSPEELEARGRRLVARLLALQNIDGGFGRWTSWGRTMPKETTIAVHALVLADRRGWVDDEEPIRRGTDSLVALTNGAAFGDYYGVLALDRTAYALRVLAEANRPQGGRASALYEQRDRLSPYGLAQLALALGSDDSRTDTLVLEAARTVLHDREDEARDAGRIRWTERTARVFGAVLEAATRFEVGRSRAGRLAGELLSIRGGRRGYPWNTSIETARALSALAAYARLWDWNEGERPTVSLDGRPLHAVSRSRAGAFFRIPVARLRGTHELRIAGGDDGAVFFSIDGRWAVPLGEHDATPRGRRTAVHRVYETADGRAIEDGTEVALGEMIRVRLFVYTEGSSPEMVAIYDPIPAGFEAVDAGHDSTPRSSLSALFGTSVDDSVVDARAHHAMRSIHSISHRAFNPQGVSFYFDRLPSGLQEYTYAVRATTVGEFTVPPTQIEALYDPGFVARGATGTLRVVER